MMNEKRLAELYDYAVRIRRELHMHPEVGFELPMTTALVSEELTKMGIAHTDRYGRSSIAADMGTAGERIAIRADMDALPVEEKTDLPFASRHPGRMHACGHDSHTAILLAVAKYFAERPDPLQVGLRLMFQPAEECSESGAEMMVKNGVTEGVSHALCIHCEQRLPAGFIGVYRGDYMAACVPLQIRFIGVTSHATVPEQGVDAIAMAMEACLKMKEAVREEAGDLRHIWSVGRFSGGHVHNVIADLCELDISFRFYDMDFAARVEKRVRAICGEIADRFGGKVEIDWHMSTGPVHNDAAVVDRFEAAVKKEGLPVREMTQKISSEDFGWYLTKVPGMLFRFGTRNEATGCCTSGHRNDFKIDEEGMKAAIRAFVAYIESMEQAKS